VATQQQFRALGVALHSQLQSARAAAYLTLYSFRPKLAQAELAQRRAAASGSSAASPRGAVAPGPRVPLGVAYVLAPVLALLGWWSLSPVLGTRLAGVVGGLLLLLPPLIHLAYGAAARAFRGVASLLGYLALGTFAGGALARTLALRVCAAEGPDECGLVVLGWLVVGAVAGGLLGYAVHGVRQVRLATHASAAG
jgi:hypothetical protein